MTQAYPLTNQFSAPEDRAKALNFFEGCMHRLRSAEMILPSEEVLIETIRAAIASQSQSVPDGWKLVPIEPTNEMQHAYFDVIDTNMERVQKDATFGRYSNNALAYKAMLAAAPDPSTSGKDGV